MKCGNGAAVRAADTVVGLSCIRGQIQNNRQTIGRRAIDGKGQGIGVSTARRWAGHTDRINARGGQITRSERGLQLGCVHENRGARRSIHDDNRGGYKRSAGQGNRGGGAASSERRSRVSNVMRRYQRFAGCAIATSDGLRIRADLLLEDKSGCAESVFGKT